MKSLILITLLATVLTIEYPKDGNHLLILNEENFDEAIKDFPYLFVKFYTPHCAHCKKLAPEFSKAAETLSKDKIQFGQIDCSSQRKLEERFDIKGYPTMKFFLNGNEIDYKGGRTEADIVDFINRKTSTVVKTLSTEEEIEQFKADNRVVSIYFGDDKEEMYAYQAASLNFDNMQFGFCSNKKLASKYAQKGQKGKIIVWKKFDENIQYFDKKITRFELIDYFKKHATPLVMSLDESTAEMIFTKKIPGLFLFIDKNNEQEKEYEKLITSVAVILKGRIQVVVTGIHKGIEKEFAEYIGITEKEIPSIRLFDTRKEVQRYHFNKEMTQENILAFVQQWENNELIPFIKSEPIPNEQHNSVIKIVGKTFKQTIEQNLDVVVKYYTSWDGNCKKLAPIFEKLAKKYKSNNKLIFGEIDIDKNETPDVMPTSLPTIHLWAAGKKKKPIEYKGTITLEGFEKFLEEQTTFPFEIINENKSDL